ncbi:hypothetical protein [Flavobacterium sp. LB2P53]|uniref:hypothetical protein n=1 Tax=Flavobacterium sp. LB2P53 TaxID=2497481 RepID=UPI000F83D307|nr:hypothetical protein [Flavobacterium sp. LB2P53]RTY71591.1 hypothetical protein EKL95_02490 [Flavobacterium sp. LB2P53]
MKKLLILLLFCCFAYSQEQYKISDANFKKLVSVSSEVATKVKLVEHFLEGNQSKLNSNNIEINDPYIQLIKDPLSKLSEKEQKKANEIVCIDCYEKWWQAQLCYKNQVVESKKRVKDSIESIRIKKFVLEKKRQDSIENIAKSKPVVVSSEKENPYDVLQRSLYAFSKTNRNLALFRKMDFNYSGPQLSSYLQSDMGMASKSFKIGATDVTETFIPKVSNGNEYLTVKYLVTKRTDIIGAYDADEVMIINSVEITGTPHLIVELFLNYWPRTVKIGGYKQGDIAFKELLGDYITISGVTPRLYKIKIGKGNMNPNYETTYGINKKK